MTPPNRFWPLYDDQEVEIYDNPFWDLPGLTRPPRDELETAPPAPRLFLREIRVRLHFVKLCRMPLAMRRKQ